MNLKKSFIKLSRNLLDSDLLQYPEALTLFIYILLKSNFKDGMSCINKQQVHIKRGQAVFGLLQASKDTHLSIRKLRTSIKYLISTGRVTRKATSKYSIITICKYDEYQNLENSSDRVNDRVSDNQTTIKRQSNDNQTTTLEEGKEGKECIWGSKKPKKTKVTKKFLKPELDEIEKYCDEYGLTIDAEMFYLYYEARDWKLKGGSSMKNWRAAAHYWQKTNEKTKNNPSNFSRNTVTETCEDRKMRELWGR